MNFSFFTEPVFTLLLTMGCFLFFSFLAQRLKMPFLNPLLLSGAFIMLFIHYSKLLTIDQYMVNSRHLLFYIAPLTVALALPLYHQRKILLKRWYLFVVGVGVSLITAFVTTVLPARFLGLDEMIVASMSPKSVTAPIAIEIASNLNGMMSLAAVAVTVAGLTGFLLGPLIVKKVSKDSPMAQGFAIGSASHILGTVKATEMGDLQAACSTIAISSMGITMTFLLPILFKL